MGRLLASGEGVLSLSEPFHLNDLLPVWALRHFYAGLQRGARLQLVSMPRVKDYDLYFDYLKKMADINHFRFLVVKEVFHEIGINPPFANFKLLDSFAAEGHAIIAIIRNPNDTIASTVKLLKKLFFGWTGRVIRTLWPHVPRFADEEAIVRWSAQNWTHFVEWARQRKLFVVRYEDLVTTPAEAMKSVCEYIGMPYHEHMLDHQRQPTVFGGIGAPEVLFSKPKPVNGQSVGRGRALPAEWRAIIDAVCGLPAADLGYTTDTVNLSPSAGQSQPS